MRTTHAIVERADALVSLLEQHRPYGEAHAVVEGKPAGWLTTSAPVPFRGGLLALSKLRPRCGP